MAFYAPTVNSYKRYVDGSWAPTRIAWSYDNRTAGFRVVGHGPSLRIECRIPGADCNPYLALAGAARRRGSTASTKQIEPPPTLRRRRLRRAATCPHVPRIAARRDRRASSGSAFAAPAFGDDVVEHYAHFFRTEQARLRRAP